MSAVPFTESDQKLLYLLAGECTAFQTILNALARTLPASEAIANTVSKVVAETAQLSPASLGALDAEYQQGYRMVMDKFAASARS